MDKLRCGKSAVWIVVLFLLVVRVIAQPGFLSIDCGAETIHTDPKNNITWVPDSKYIDVGHSGYTGDISQEISGSFMQYLRYFPMPLNKSCYRLPVAPSMPYLLRLWFAIGNFSGFDAFPINFAFSIETLGMLASQNISFRSANLPYSFENILVSSGTVLYICLIRTSESHDPFISAIELRTLRNGMYPQATAGTMLGLVSRHDVGGNSSVRYPHDSFDRIWTSSYMSLLFPSSNTQEPISTNNTQDLPPTVVMQTAWITTEDILEFYLRVGPSKKTESLLLLYFAEMQPLNMTETRSFHVLINGKELSQPITMVQNYSAVELALRLGKTLFLDLALLKATDSTLGPILNAFENYLILNTDIATYSEDIEALEAIERRFDIKNWTSDPCYLVPWEGIGCDNISFAMRISEINLSGKNLTGSIPGDIGNLTALVELSLDNNHLIGPLPNFSSLTRLERLHLQNNYLTGPVPDWLSQLKSLKELFIENNNFSGMIPPQLLHNPSLNLSYSDNPSLCTDEGGCIQETQTTRGNSRKDREGVVLGITISGGLIIALGLVVTIAVYWKKFMKKHRLKVMVPNAAKFGGFTLKEMMRATQNFSQKIGQGGFGSVFLGKLPEGKDIAVKVLSAFSKQGIHEFETEVNLLSRVNHKNLVSLVGYCKESKELMLIYEHMSGGSLRDHLYGRAGVSELNWKARLKIALDAAQGLEYLHVGCIPKIIHRDVKTANILLDSNINGKLADFGLSRMTIGEEATHVTTTVKGTAGYLDPDYFRTQMLTDKSDVYSFGVVLLEIICGRPPINTNLQEELNLIQWVTPYVEMDENPGQIAEIVEMDEDPGQIAEIVEMDENPGQIAEIIDKRLGLNYHMKSVKRIAKLALRCVKAKPSSRPSMSEVVAEIKLAIVHENDNNDSLPNSEGIGIEYGNLQEGEVLSRAEPSKPKDMEWGDNSSNLPQVGR